MQAKARAHAAVDSTATGLDRAVRVLEPVMRAIAAIGILVLMLMTIANIALRTTGRGITGVIEITEVLLVVIVFLGMTTAGRDGQHIRASLLTDRLPGEGSRGVRISAAVISLGILAWMISATTIRAIASVHAGEFRFGLVPVPIWPARVVIPIGLAALAVVVVLQLVSLLARRSPVMGLTPNEFTSPDAIESSARGT